MTDGRASLTFLGGARTVTGSKYLLDTGTRKVLIDCGLFQGRKELRLRNWEDLPVDPASIDAVVLTHAHVDHCGYVPRLVRSGFRGAVWCTRGTRRLCEIVLPDSGHLHEEEAAFANRHGYSRHQPALPLYTERDAVNALASFVDVPFHHAVEVVPGVEVVWRHAGHILGAATLEVHLIDHGHRLAFSGDLGRTDHPLLLAPEPIGAADVVVCESTYGDGEHDDSRAEDVLAEVITATARRGGVILVPAFAVDRTELVLHLLDQLHRAQRVPQLPVFVDSPMASAALELYRSEARDGSEEMRQEVRGSELFGHVDLHETRSVEDSRSLSARHGPMVVISASGMATGGRVLHHLAARMGDSRNTILLAGFQAPGTRGERLASGARTVRLLGADREVAAQVRSLRLSAHADRRELTEWLGSSTARPDCVYVTHGEPHASESFAAHVRTALGADAVVPHLGQQVWLDRDHRGAAAN